MNKREKNWHLQRGRSPDFLLGCDRQYPDEGFGEDNRNRPDNRGRNLGGRRRDFRRSADRFDRDVERTMERFDEGFEHEMRKYAWNDSGFPPSPHRLDAGYPLRSSDRDEYGNGNWKSPDRFERDCGDRYQDRLHVEREFDHRSPDRVLRDHNMRSGEDRNFSRSPSRQGARFDDHIDRGQRGRVTDDLRGPEHLDRRSPYNKRDLDHYDTILRDDRSPEVARIHERLEEDFRHERIPGRFERDFREGRSPGRFERNFRNGRSPERSERAYDDHRSPARFCAKPVDLRIPEVFNSDFEDHRIPDEIVSRGGWTTDLISDRNDLHGDDEMHFRPNIPKTDFAHRRSPEILEERDYAMEIYDDRYENPEFMDRHAFVQDDSSQNRCDDKPHHYYKRECKSPPPERFIECDPYEISSRNFDEKDQVQAHGHSSDGHLESDPRRWSRSPDRSKPDGRSGSQSPFIDPRRWSRSPNRPRYDGRLGSQSPGRDPRRWFRSPNRSRYGGRPGSQSPVRDPRRWSRSPNRLRYDGRPGSQSPFRNRRSWSRSPNRQRYDGRPGSQSPVRDPRRWSRSPNRYRYDGRPHLQSPARDLRHSSSNSDRSFKRSPKDVHEANRIFKRAIDETGGSKMHDHNRLFRGNIPKEIDKGVLLEDDLSDVRNNKNFIESRNPPATSRARLIEDGHLVEVIPGALLIEDGRLVDVAQDTNVLSDSVELVYDVGNVDQFNLPFGEHERSKEISISYEKHSSQDERERRRDQRKSLSPTRSQNSYRSNHSSQSLGKRNVGRKVEIDHGLVVATVRNMSPDYARKTTPNRSKETNKSRNSYRSQKEDVNRDRSSQWQGSRDRDVHTNQSWRSRSRSRSPLRSQHYQDKLKSEGSKSDGNRSKKILNCSRSPDRSRESRSPKRSRDSRSPKKQKHKEEERKSNHRSGTCILDSRSSKSSTRDTEKIKGSKDKGDNQEKGSEHRGDQQRIDDLLAGFKIVKQVGLGSQTAQWNKDAQGADISSRNEISSVPTGNSGISTTVKQNSRLTSSMSGFTDAQPASIQQSSTQNMPQMSTITQNVLGNQNLARQNQLQASAGYGNALNVVEARIRQQVPCSVLQQNIQKVVQTTQQVLHQTHQMMQSPLPLLRPQQIQIQSIQPVRAPGSFIQTTSNMQLNMLNVGQHNLQMHQQSLRNAFHNNQQRQGTCTFRNIVPPVATSAQFGNVTNLVANASSQSVMHGQVWGKLDQFPKSSTPRTLTNVPMINKSSNRTGQGYNAVAQLRKNLDTNNHTSNRCSSGQNLPAQLQKNNTNNTGMHSQNSNVTMPTAQVKTSVTASMVTNHGLLPLNKPNVRATVVTPQCSVVIQKLPVLFNAGNETPVELSKHQLALSQHQQIEEAKRARLKEAEVAIKQLREKINKQKEADLKSEQLKDKKMMQTAQKQENSSQSKQIRKFGTEQSTGKPGSSGSISKGITIKGTVQRSSKESQSKYLTGMEGKFESIFSSEGISKRNGSSPRESSAISDGLKSKTNEKQDKSVNKQEKANSTKSKESNIKEKIKQSYMKEVASRGKKTIDAGDNLNKSKEYISPSKSQQGKKTDQFQKPKSSKTRSGHVKTNTTAAATLQEDSIAKSTNQSHSDLKTIPDNIVDVTADDDVEIVEPPPLGKQANDFIIISEDEEEDGNDEHVFGNIDLKKTNSSKEKIDSDITSKTSVNVTKDFYSSENISDTCAEKLLNEKTIHTTSSRADINVQQHGTDDVVISNKESQVTEVTSSIVAKESGQPWSVAMQPVIDTVERSTDNDIDKNEQGKGKLGEKETSDHVGMVTTCGTFISGDGEMEKLTSNELKSVQISKEVEIVDKIDSTQNEEVMKSIDNDSASNNLLVGNNSQPNDSVDLKDLPLQLSADVIKDSLSDKEFVSIDANSKEITDNSTKDLTIQREIVFTDFKDKGQDGHSKKAMGNEEISLCQNELITQIISNEDIGSSQCKGTKEVISNEEICSSQNERSKEVISNEEICGNQNERTKEVISNGEICSSQNEQSKEVISNEEICGNQNEQTKEVISNEEICSSQNELTKKDMSDKNIDSNQNAPFVVDHSSDVSKMGNETDIGSCVSNSDIMKDTSQIETFCTVENVMLASYTELTDLNQVELNSTIDKATPSLLTDVIVSSELASSATKEKVMHSGNTELTDTNVTETSDVTEKEVTARAHGLTDTNQNQSASITELTYTSEVVSDGTKEKETQSVNELTDTASNEIGISGLTENVVITIAHVLTDVSQVRTHSMTEKAIASENDGLTEYSPEYRSSCMTEKIIERGNTSLTDAIQEESSGLKGKVSVSGNTELSNSLHAASTKVRNVSVVVSSEPANDSSGTTYLSSDSETVISEIQSVGAHATIQDKRRIEADDTGIHVNQKKESLKDNSGKECERLQTSTRNAENADNMITESSLEITVDETLKVKDVSYKGTKPQDKSSVESNSHTADEKSKGITDKNDLSPKGSNSTSKNRKSPNEKQPEKKEENLPKGNNSANKASSNACSTKLPGWCLSGKTFVRKQPISAEKVNSIGKENGKQMARTVQKAVNIKIKTEPDNDSDYGEKLEEEKVMPRGITQKVLKVKVKVEPKETKSGKLVEVEDLKTESVEVGPKEAHSTEQMEVELKETNSTEQFEVKPVETNSSESVEPKETNLAESGEPDIICKDNDSAETEDERAETCKIKRTSTCPIPDCLVTTMRLKRHAYSKHLPWVLKENNWNKNLNRCAYILRQLTKWILGETGKPEELCLLLNESGLLPKNIEIVDSDFESLRKLCKSQSWPERDSYTLHPINSPACFIHWRAFLMLLIYIPDEKRQQLKKLGSSSATYDVKQCSTEPVKESRSTPMQGGKLLNSRSTSINSPAESKQEGNRSAQNAKNSLREVKKHKNKDKKSQSLLSSTPADLIISDTKTTHSKQQVQSSHSSVVKQTVQSSLESGVKQTVQTSPGSGVKQTVQSSPGSGVKETVQNSPMSAVKEKRTPQTKSTVQSVGSEPKQQAKTKPVKQQPLKRSTETPILDTTTKKIKMSPVPTVNESKTATEKAASIKHFKIPLLINKSTDNNSNKGSCDYDSNQIPTLLGRKPVLEPRKADISLHYPTWKEKETISSNKNDKSNDTGGKSKSDFKVIDLTLADDKSTDRNVSKTRDENSEKKSMSGSNSKNRSKDKSTERGRRYSRSPEGSKSRIHRQSRSPNHERTRRRSLSPDRGRMKHGRDSLSPLRENWRRYRRSLSPTYDYFGPYKGSLSPDYDRLQRRGDSRSPNHERAATWKRRDPESRQKSRSYRERNRRLKSPESDSDTLVICPQYVNSKSKGSKRKAENSLMEECSMRKNKKEKHSGSALEHSINATLHELQRGEQAKTGKKSSAGVKNFPMMKMPTKGNLESSMWSTLEQLKKSSLPDTMKKSLEDSMKTALEEMYRNKVEEMKKAATYIATARGISTNNTAAQDAPMLTPPISNLKNPALLTSTKNQDANMSISSEPEFKRSPTKPPVDYMAVVKSSKNRPLEDIRKHEEGRYTGAALPSSSRVRDSNTNNTPSARKDGYDSKSERSPQSKVEDQRRAELEASMKNALEEFCSLLDSSSSKVAQSDRSSTERTIGAPALWEFRSYTPSPTKSGKSDSSAKKYGVINYEISDEEDSENEASPNLYKHCLFKHSSDVGEQKPYVKDWNHQSPWAQWQQKLSELPQAVPKPGQVDIEGDNDPHPNRFTRPALQLHKDLMNNQWKISVGMVDKEKDESQRGGPPGGYAPPPGQPGYGAPPPGQPGYGGGYPQPGGYPAGGGYGGPGGPPAGIDPSVYQWFLSVDQDKSGHITAHELQQALVNGNWSHFNPETCRLMISLFDRDNSGTIQLHEFQSLWNYIQQWKGVFERFDSNRSGSIEAAELMQAFQQMGYNLSPQFGHIVIAKFDVYGRRSLTLDNFIQSCVMLKSLTDSFKQRDPQMVGNIRMGYEDFMTTAIFNKV